MLSENYSPWAGRKVERDSGVSNKVFFNVRRAERETRLPPLLKFIWSWTQGSALRCKAFLTTWSRTNQ